MNPAADALAHHTCGELIATVYAGFLLIYGDEELASVATAAVLQDLVMRAEDAREEEPCA